MCYRKLPNLFKGIELWHTIEKIYPSTYEQSVTPGGRQQKRISSEDSHDLYPISHGTES